MNNPLTRQFPMLLVLALALGFAAGCTEKDTTPPAAPAVPAALFAERLSAAQAISDSFKRDASLMAVTAAAAEAGDAAVVKEGVSNIRDSFKRDAAAAAAALALAKAGKRGDATEVARMIRDSSKRDATLSQLANE